MVSASVIVGSNVAYAAKVHAMRPLWPNPEHWPAQWWERLLGVAQSGLNRLVVALVTANGSAASLTEGLQLRIGTEALSFIREAFIVKTRGGTDEAGESWKPLSISYLVYGRRHPGRRLPHTSQGPPNRGRLAASQWGPGRSRRPMLTKKQDATWRGIFASLLKRGVNRQIAARIAWAAVKKMGGQTVWSKYSPPPPAEINRDTGVLFNSLSPGVEGNVLRVEKNGT